MSQRLATIRSRKGLRRRIGQWRSNGERVALVPTMGALHEGHLSLVRLAKAKTDRTVVSIFVNPTQFGPNEDFEQYPRDEAADRAKLKALGVDLVYAPAREEVYPPGFQTHVVVDKLSKGLCGESRPGHFSGVATVVTKLLLQCLPDIAIFGEKDYQQLQVIKRMVLDLDIPVSIVGGPIVREPDGLAMSSRNAYLSKAHRAAAPLLHACLKDAAEKLASGQTVGRALGPARQRLQAAGFRVDYLEARDAATLEPVRGQPDRPTRLFAAAFLGKTRLIDNVPVRAR